MFSASAVKDKVARFFSAHPVLKHLMSAIQVSIILLFTYCLVYHISEDGYEFQQLINLKNAVCIISVLVMAIFLVPRPGIYRAIAVVGLICAILSGIIVSNFLRARFQHGSLIACKSNLKNISTALEMYSSDHKGLYPKSLAEITPDYLRTLPTCPDGGRMSYRYVSTSSPDIYTVWCEGVYHADKSPINMPQYDSVKGLYER